MSTVYGYANQYWRVINDFTYTGQTENITLPQGKYLLICNGAPGGVTSADPASLTYGGTSYGILNLTDSSTDMFINVGGDGSAVGHIDTKSSATDALNYDWKDGILPESNDNTLDTSTTRLSCISYIPITIELKSPTVYPFNIIVNGIDTSGNPLEWVGYFYDENNNFIDTTSVYYNNTTPYVCNLTNARYMRLIIRKSTSTSTDILPTDIMSISVTFSVDIRCGGNGGFNGGGDGSASLSTTGLCGAGGGGASDIRIGTDSLYSRVIVAGGGGGNTTRTRTDAGSTNCNYLSFGGGPVGGPVAYPSDNQIYYASQNSGYSFGNGMSGVMSPNTSINGASGGGGGWFGGYSPSIFNSINQNYSDANAGGGSGYVLTEDSYKPDGYLLDEKYYLTDTFMNCGTSVMPHVQICAWTKSLNIGDELIIPSTNSSFETTFNSGIYKISCYGGHGGVRQDISKASIGGFAQGTLTLNDAIDIYAYVAGSGLSNGVLADALPQHTEFGDLYNTNRSFNGGGNPGSTSILSCAGGGASDIRIGTDSLYSRVIVAGGGGGMGANFKGSNGGGLSGDPLPSGGYGTNPGPGTQNSSPQDASKITINGGFGFGGNGTSVNGGFGGAGGSGWFGGSGTYPDSSGDDDKGGCGGSGYVLTEDSYKPDGYLLDEKYYLTDTTLTTGGSNLPIGTAMIKIDVINVSNTQLLCYDNEGYKYLNTETDKWELIPESIEHLSKEVFDKYASSSIKTDEGLLDEYEVLTYDTSETDDIEVVLNVVPNEQHISTQISDSVHVRHITPDVEFDADVYDLTIGARRKIENHDSKMFVDININKKIKSEKKFRLYSINLSE